jgi:uncharacterized integral membrane protein (TIGR00698 family)
MRQICRVSPAPAAPPSAASGWAALAPGLVAALAIAVVATGIGKLVPVIGGPVTGIVIGVVVAAVHRPGERLRPGIRFAGKTILQVAVVALGAQLSLAQIAKVGLGSLPVMLGTLAACLLAAFWIGRWLGLVGDLRTLIGVGTGICGASAIAAVTPVIDAASVDVAYAVSTIFLFNVAAVLLFPAVGHLLGMSQHSFGLFAGTAVNDTSSVVAAATTYGQQALGFAVVVKLTRTLLIIPICLALAGWEARRRRSGAPVPATAGDPVPGSAAAQDPGPTQDGGSPSPSPSPSPARAPVHVLRLVPKFLVLFLFVAALNSVGLIPASLHPGLNEASVFLITVALSAIGLSTDVAGLRRTGPRPLLLGASLWVVVALSSLGLQYLTGSL